MLFTPGGSMKRGFLFEVFLKAQRALKFFLKFGEN